MVCVMKEIPTPWPFGQIIELNKSTYRFTGVTWFYWESQNKWDYTYVFEDPDKEWTNTKLFTTRDFDSLPYSIDIEESLLDEKPIKEHGHPLTGTGHMTGIIWQDGKLFADFLITNRYFEHIRSECDEHGLYNNGIVSFPRTPSYDSPEKQAKAVLSSYLKTHSA